MAGVPIPMITAAPAYQPPYGGRIPFGDGLEKRQDLTFSSCGLDCATDYFCQGYRSSYGFCCPSSVLTRTEFNYCGPATVCVDYGVSSVSDFFYDSTRSTQYCGQDRPHCATYIYTNDRFTQVFCAASASGVFTFDTTSTAGQSATFLPGPGATTSSRVTAENGNGTPIPTAVVVSRTTSGSSSTSSTGTTTTATTSAVPSNSSSLGTGAVAGIAVGAALGGIGLAVAAFFFWRRSSRKPKGGSGGGHSQFPPPQPPVAEQSGYYQHQQPYAPIPQGHGAELGGDSFKPPNLQGQGQGNPVFELGGGGNTAPPYQPPYQETAAPYWSGPGRQELQG
ncbi:hypothetical protein TWF696_006800 [Orbilia brochopaga]|uniref:Uncharacterized protein n=1 Tax=Orbilia brochopaga TaxID=3140254 RepID=A0AAV9UTL2_9PEZI